MRISQRGSSSVQALLGTVFIFGFLYWIAWDYMPSKAEDLQKVVSLAESHPKAKEALADLLKETPAPNNNQLKRIRSSVNEIVLLETSKKVTGDPSLAANSGQVQKSHQFDGDQNQALFDTLWNLGYLVGFSLVVGLIITILIIRIPPTGRDN